MSNENGDELLGKVDDLIAETEKKIDAQLALIDELEGQGKCTETATRGFISLVNTLEKLAELKISLTK